MTIQDFMLEGKRAVLSGLREYGEHNVVVKETERIKPNDTRVYGLDLRREGSQCGSLVYIDDLFERYTKGEDFDILMDEVTERCISGLVCAAPPEVTDPDLSLENIRSRLTLRLLSVKRNTSYMKDKPYIDVGNGLALIASINCDESVASEWRIAVTDSLLEEIGCDRETLLTAALANTMELEPPVLMKLKDALTSRLEGGRGAYNYFQDKCIGAGRTKKCELKKCDPSQCQDIYILTNKSMFQGAAVLFYPETMKKVAGFLECGFSVIPSSVHEVIIVPDCMILDRFALRSFLVTGNNHFVEAGDILADAIYHYDPETDSLRYLDPEDDDEEGEERLLRFPFAF